MICEKCNTHNNKECKFCIRCGTKLPNYHRDTYQYCDKCDTRNSDSSSFCLNCGNNLSHHKQCTNSKKDRAKRIKRRGQNKELNLNSLIKSHKVVSLALTLILLFLVYQSIPANKRPSNTNYLSDNISTIAVNDSVYSTVIAKFDCSCGKCDDPLNVCSCETAIEERNFIESKSLQHLGTNEIIKAVNNKYGGLKI